MRKKENTITEKDLENFKEYLISKSFSKRTVQKYSDDTRAFGNFLENKKITPKILEDFKQKQLEKYTAVSVKAAIFGINSYLEFKKSPYRIEQVEAVIKKRDISQTAITKEEYLSLLKEAKRSGNNRLALIIESICAAGLKLSQLQYLTVEAVIKNNVELPGKRSSVYLPKNLRDDLLEYCRDNDIFMGMILVTNKGTVLDKGNVSRELKSVCGKVGIDPERVSAKTLREYYLKSFEDYRSEVVEMMDREWREKKTAI